MPKTVTAFGGTEALQAFNSRAHDPLTPYFAATFAAFIPRPVLPGLSEKRFSRSRPGRTSTDRSRCSSAHAVWSEPISNVRCRLSAEIPSLLAANSQEAVNQTVSGVRVRSKMVPAVTDVRPPHPEHR